MDSPDLNLIASLVMTKDLILKVLGPTADYIGSGMKDWTQKRVDSFRRIIEKAARLLGDTIGPGKVHPRVLKEIIYEGTFMDDSLAEAYFAGVLASSKKETFQDDRGATLLKRLSLLSTHQIRAHYIFYCLFKKLFDNTEVRITNPEANKLLMFIPYISFQFSMCLIKPDDNERLNEGGSSSAYSDDVLMHCIYGLLNEDLLRLFVSGADFILEKKIHQHY